MRWGVPWFMLMMLVVTLLLLEQGVVYQVALVLQVVFYLLALAGWLSPGVREIAVVKIIFFFVQTNIALAQAAVLYLSGKRMTTWNPSRR